MSSPATKHLECAEHEHDVPPNYNFRLIFRGGQKILQTRETCRKCGANIWTDIQETVE